MSRNLLIEEASRFLNRMTSNGRDDDMDDDEEIIIPDPVNVPHLRTFNTSELDDDWSQEHNVQATLFGQNDYIPIKNVSNNIQESIEPTDNPKRLLVKSDVSSGKANGLMVPTHMWEGNYKEGNKKTNYGMRVRNDLRAAIYGGEQRPPMTSSEILNLHKNILSDHFAKPQEEQISAERAAIERLHAAGHLDSMDTTDPGEKTDTVKVETDEVGRNFVARSSKRVAGRALYTSGSGDSAKHYIINVCPGQTEGCGGGVDANGIADTLNGSCFAPNSEQQYVNAAVRRAAQTQAYHDPKMSADWILAHVHSLRRHAEAADLGTRWNPKRDRLGRQSTTPKRFLFRPNVLDESDVSSRIVLKYLNKERKANGRPTIVANSYGKTNELHDPENDYYVTFSNTGPKTKHGKKISENFHRDATRVAETVLAANKSGVDKVNEQGHQVPPKNSYVVSNIKRYSPLDEEFRANVNSARYWTKGREQSELTDAEKQQGPEGHYDGEGNPTPPEYAHYGHRTVNGRRYDYQKQHVLHPRYVMVDGKSIATDSRFKDEEFLPEARFKSPNGKPAGALLITTPTTSTSDDGHNSNFTHDFNQRHIEQAKRERGLIDIDLPEDQEQARIGGEYVSPTEKKKRKAVAKEIKALKAAKGKDPLLEQYVSSRIRKFMMKKYGD